MISSATSHRRVIVRPLLATPILSFVLLLSGCAEEQGYSPRGNRERVYRSARSDNQDYYRDERREGSWRDDYRRNDPERDDDERGRRRYEQEDRRSGSYDDGGE